MPDATLSTAPTGAFSEVSSSSPQPWPGSPAVRQFDSEDLIPQLLSVGDTLLGLYEILEELGRGGMGVVFRVHHRLWNIDLALKSPLITKGAIGFVSEAQTWVSLPSHPNVVRCHYVRVLGAIPRIFMEYVEGGSLHDAISSQRLYANPSAFAQILRIGIETARGLHHAHLHGILHQDFKPQNVMLSLKGLAKVTDFGLCRLSNLPSQGQTSAAAAGGTPAYMSPEQALALTHKGNPQRLTPASDIYSFALVMLEMLAGRRLSSHGQTGAPVLAQLRRDQSFRVQSPDSLLDFLEKLLSLNPNRRPQTMAEVASFLESVAVSSGVSHLLSNIATEAVSLADELNNRAVSLLDLKCHGEALRTFEQALASDPQHLVSRYNRALLRWRAAQCTDDLAIAELQQLASPPHQAWLSSYLIGCLHLERGDRAKAEIAFTKAEQDCHEASPRARIESARKTMTEGSSCERILPGHSGPILALSASADLSRIVSAGADATLRVWSSDSSICLHTLRGHEQALRAVACSRDGKRALSFGLDRSMRIWNLENGSCLGRASGPSMDRVGAVAISRDGTTAISAGETRTLRYWELASGSCLLKISENKDPIRALALSSDNAFVVAGGYDGTLRVWDLSSGACLRSMPGHTFGISSIDISADDQFCLSGSQDRSLRLWSLRSGECLGIFLGHTDEVTCLSLQAHLGLAASGGEDGMLRIWELASGRCLQSFADHRGAIRGVALAQDGTRLVTAGIDSELRIYRLGPGRQAPLELVLPSESLFEEQALAHSFINEARKALDENRLSEALVSLRLARKVPGFERSKTVLAQWDRAHRLARRTSLSELWLDHHVDSGVATIRVLVSDLRARILVGACGRTVVSVWDSSGRPLASLLGHAQTVHSVSVDRRGTMAVSASSDSEFRLFDLSTGLCEGSARVPGAGSSCLAMSASGDIFVSGGEDGSLRVWDRASMQNVASFSGHRGAVSCVALSRDGRFAVTGGDDRSVRVWDLIDSLPICSFEYHRDLVRAVVVSPDARLAVSASADGEMIVWDLSSQNPIRWLGGHSLGITALALSSDCDICVSSGLDGVIKIWNIRSGTCLWELAGQRDRIVSSLILHPDARYLVAAFRNGKLSRWVLDWELEERPSGRGWNEEARPLLQRFLTEQAMAQSKMDAPFFEDLSDLFEDLESCGFGAMLQTVVRQELVVAKAAWDGPSVVVRRRKK